MMRKRMYVLTVAIMLCMAVRYSHAQMIDYSRRNKKSAEKKISQPVKPVADTFGQRVRQRMRSLPAVANKIEAVYDLNLDGKMQEAEIKKFYADAIWAVERKGKFTAASALLKDFDANGDGFIDASEAVTLAMFAE